MAATSSSTTLTVHSSCTDCGAPLSLLEAFTDLPCATLDELILCGVCRALHLYSCQPCREDAVTVPSPRRVTLVPDMYGYGEPEDYDWELDA